MDFAAPRRRRAARQRCRLHRARSPSSSTRVADAAPTPRTALAPPVQLACRGLFKSYRKGAIGIPVLQGIDLEVREGEFLAIVGQSGCGKSTLLHLLGTLDKPDAGEVAFRRPPHRQPARAGARPAAQQALRHDLSVLPPAAGALDAGERPGAGADRREHARLLAAARRASPAGATSCWSWSACRHRAKHKPRELSGGEMQRAAIARALLVAAQGAAGRRADRQPRPRHRRADHANARRVEPPRKAHYSHGDARPLDRRPGRPHGPAGRRPHPEAA